MALYPPSQCHFFAILWSVVALGKSCVDVTCMDVIKITALICCCWCCWGLESWWLGFWWWWSSWWWLWWRWLWGRLWSNDIDKYFSNTFGIHIYFQSPSSLFPLHIVPFMPIFFLVFLFFFLSPFLLPSYTPLSFSLPSFLSLSPFYCIHLPRFHLSPFFFISPYLLISSYLIGLSLNFSSCPIFLLSFIYFPFLHFLYPPSFLTYLFSLFICPSLNLSCTCSCYLTLS